MGTTRVFRRTCAALLGAAMLTALLPVTAGAQVGSPAQDPPPPASDETFTGQEAIDELGSELPEVAAAHKLSTAELRSRFQTDETLWVDATERLYYVEPTAEEAAPEALEAPQLEAAAPFPLADTFLLHSRPGADRVIYLDFDGHTATGTGWNVHPTYGSPTIASTAFSLDGNAAAFSDSEREMVQSVWERVVEDYAPFDVDITTQDPGLAAIDRTNTGDLEFGTQVVFAGTNPMQAQCGCGGLAYIGVYNLTGSNHQYYQPAYVYQQGVGGASTSAKLLAEAASHEAGHNFGLNHDGVTAGASYYTGHGAWAPIMGVGYNKPIVQWSSGEYTGANNPQDDLAVIQSLGLPPLADDHGNTNGAATALLAEPFTSIGGAITTRADVDAFSFVAPGGLVTLSATPAPTSPNLDISLSLYDGVGTLVATDNPASGTTSIDVASGLSASLSQTLAAGSYFVQVDGVSALTPATGYSDYASLGSYEMTATLGVCADDDDLDDDDTDTARLLIAGQAASGKRCADDDLIRVAGFNGGTLTSGLTALDADLSLDVLDAAGTQLATVAVAAGATQPLVFPFTANADHFLRVRGGVGTESRYTITTAMPACPPLDQYESGNFDDFLNFATPLNFPGNKDATSCSGDPNNADTASVSGVAGREITATLRYPQAAGSLQLFIFRGSVSGTSISAGVTTTNTTDQIELRYTPTATDTYQLMVRWVSGATAYRLSVDQAPPPEVAPTITDVTPLSGAIDDEITITGTGFDTVHSVAFSDDAYTSFALVSPTQITATVPASASDGPITVTNGAGSATSASFDVTGPPNGVPDAVDDEKSVAQASTTVLRVLSNDTDPDGDPLTIIGYDAIGANGGAIDCSVATTNGESCLFSAAAATTDDSFDYWVSDGNGGTDMASVAVTIGPCPDLAPAMSTGGLVTGESWLVCSAVDASAEVTTTPDHMTTGGGTVALLTNGAVSEAEPPNSDGESGRDNDTRHGGAYDASVKQLDLDIPAGANCLSFQLVFGSEAGGIAALGGQGSTDAFLAELDGTGWSVDDLTGEITAANNFAVDPSGNLISLDSQFINDPITNDTGTGYDALTPVLLVRTPIDPGQHALYLSIFDVGNGTLDSGAFVDDLAATTETEGSCTAGVVASPTVTDISPSSGAVGDPITITGTGFDNADAVYFTDDIPADFTVQSSTTVTATVPAGATDGPITVQGSTGSAESSSFTVVPPTLVRFEETASAFAFGPGWSSWTNAAQSGGKAQTTSTLGASAQFVFTGTTLRWIGQSGPARAKASISIDGVDHGTVDTYTTTYRDKANLFTVTGLTPGDHTITITHAGKNPAAAPVSSLVLDAFDTPGSPTLVRFEETASAFAFGPGWSSWTNAAQSGGKAQTTSTLGASAQFVFTGTTLRWIGQSGPARAKASISIDGVDHGTVDTYTTTYRDKANLFTVTGLTPGDHTITITHAGKNPAAAPVSSLVLDAFDTPGSPTLVRFEETASAFAFGPGWSSWTNAAQSGGKAQTTSTLGASAQFVFTGTTLRWIGQSGPARAKASISIDGVDHGTVDTYTTTYRDKANLFTVTGLTPGDHTITITHAGKNPAAAPVSSLVLDAFDTPGSPTLVRFEETASAFAFGPGWSSWTNAAQSGGKAQTTSTLGASAQFVFTGTTLRWIGQSGPARAKASISIDGVDHGTVDTYTTTYRDKANLFTVTGLTPGDHTITITHAGKNPAAAPVSSLVLDAFDTPGSPTLVRFEETASAFAFGPGWSSWTNAAQSGGKAQTTSTLGASAQFVFTGTTLRWIGQSGPARAKASISIDGVDHGTVDTYTTTYRDKANLFTVTGLTPGDHTITITHAGKNPAAAPVSSLVLDAFDTPGSP